MTLLTRRKSSKDYVDQGKIPPKIGQSGANRFKNQLIIGKLPQGHIGVSHFEVLLGENHFKNRSH